MLDAYDGPADGTLLERIRLRARWSYLDWLARALERDVTSLPHRLTKFDHVFAPTPEARRS